MRQRYRIIVAKGFGESENSTLVANLTSQPILPLLTFATSSRKG